MPSRLTETTPRALKGILEQTKMNFHNSLKQAEDLSRSENQADEASAAPTSAHKMNGFVIPTS